MCFSVLCLRHCVGCKNQSLCGVKFYSEKIIVLCIFEIFARKYEQGVSRVLVNTSKEKGLSHAETAATGLFCKIQLNI